jgi:hypothetical protein
MTASTYDYRQRATAPILEQGLVLGGVHALHEHTQLKIVNIKQS